MKYIKISILTVLALVAVSLGSLFSTSVLSYAQEKYTELQTFSKVLNIVQEYYVEKVEVKRLVQGAIKGMLSELDPHTNYMNKEIFKEFEKETTGEFSGLGVEISVQDEILTVISPIEDTPAYKAGIKAGDKIVSIDGKSTKGLNLIEAAQLIKGKLGTSVELKIFRKGQKEPLTIHVKRARIKIKSVKYTDLEDGYAYIKLTSFIDNSYRDFKKVINSHTKKDAKLKGLIIDLRNNPGGLLTQAIKISDLFLNEGVIVSTIGRNEKEKEVVYATPDDTLKEPPIIVLVNEASASASEIVAGALKDHKRAVIMGQRTFGKGSVQSVIKLGDGSGLKLTVARYYTPSGTSIQATGIVPDIELEHVDSKAFQKAIVKSKAKREADIEGHLKNDNEKKYESFNPSDLFWLESDKDNNKKLTAKQKLLKNDYQIFQAYNYLKAWKVFENH
tara:strand:+ start:13067 stop:14404 length:1338 start_codon:yes stop_codon:yes gene_type:complete